jgi:hypothetical protein
MRTVRYRALCLLGAALIGTGAVSAASPRSDVASGSRLDGVWEISQGPKQMLAADGGPPPLRSSAQVIYQHNRDALAADVASADSYARCLPPGLPRLFSEAGAFRIAIGQQIAGMFFERQHQFRLINLDVPHFQSVGPSWLGQSIGHRDGKTLSVDTNDFNDTTWLDASGLPHSGDLHLQEKFSVEPDGRLMLLMTIDDPKTFTHSWQTVLFFRRSTRSVLREDYCLRRQGLLDGKISG